MPRKYDLGKRAAAVADTRRRILDAAVEVYAERGLSGATFQEIARRADVAAGTVHYQFATPEELQQAALERIRESLDVPTPALFDGVRDPVERLRRLVAALFEFYDRSTVWYRLFEHDRGTVRALQEGERRFYEDLQRLVAAAVDPTDPEVMAVVFAMAGPGTRGAFLQAGFDEAGAVEKVTELLARWIAGKASKRA